MASDQEIFKFIAQIEGKEEIDRAAAAAASLAEQKFEALYSTLGKGHAQTRAAAAAYIDLKESLEAAELAAAKLGGQLTKVQRAGAAGRAALLGANILQDAAYNPVYAINNVLGAANDSGIKALASEAIEAAGGIRVVATALGTVAAVAGSAFVVIDQGLKSNELGWSDLGSVIDTAAAGSFTHAGKAIGETLGAAKDFITGIVGSVADVTIGWNDAAGAVRSHKDEVEKAAQAVRDYTVAQRELAKVRSGDQEKATKGGQAFVDELAEIGGKGGLDAVLDRLADAETAQTGKEKVKVPTLDEKGNVSGEEEITRREQARRRLALEVLRAQGGDQGAQGRLKAQLGTIGEDASDLGIRKATAAHQAKINADTQALINQGADETAEEAERARKQKAKEDEERADREAQSVNAAMDQQELTDAPAREKAASKRRVGRSLRRMDFLGVDEDDLTAEQKKAKGLFDDAAKANESVREAGGRLMKDNLEAMMGDRRNSQVIGSADLAGSIQGAVGGPDKDIKRIADLTAKGNEYLELIAEQRQAQGRVAGALAFNAQGNLAPG